MRPEVHLQNTNSITRQVTMSEKLPLDHGELVQWEMTDLLAHWFTVS
jgi:hypothetical protein